MNRRIEISDDLIKTLKEQQVTEIYDFVEQYLESLEGLTVEDLQCHLRAQMAATALGNVNGPQHKAINALRQKIEEMGGNPDDIDDTLI